MKQQEVVKLSNEELSEQLIENKKKYNAKASDRTWFYIIHLKFKNLTKAAFSYQIF